MSPLERLDAAMNPVWIKEVRQSLRSRLLRVGLMTMLLVGAFAAIVTIGPSDNPRGATMFGTVYAALMFAVTGIVPFYTFYSAPGEGQTSGLELTLLTGLAPSRVANGRLLAALTHIALFYCAFLPFLALSALMPGVDLLAAALLLAIAALLGACTSAVAIALGAILRSRMARGLVGLALSGVLFYVAAGGAVLALQLLLNPESMLEPEFPLILGAALLPPVAFGVYGLGAATAALTHPEENRGTPLRVATVIFAALGLLGVEVLARSGPIQPEALAIPTLVVLGALGVPCGVFLVEPDRLGRRVRVTLPRRALALALAPMLPGGQRAIAFAAGLLTATVLGASWIIGDADTERLLAAQSLWTALAYGAIYLLIPAIIFRPWLHVPAVRWVAMLSMPGLCVAGVLVPSLIGVILDVDDLERGNHAGNPFWMLGRFFTGAASEGAGLGVQIAALAVLLLNVPRAVRGWAEVEEATAPHDPPA